MLLNNQTECKSNGDRNKTLSIEEYFNKIRVYLKDISNFIKSDTWKIHLIKTIKFVSSQDIVPECLMYSKSDSIETTINDKADEVIEQLFSQFFLHIKSFKKQQ